MTKLHHIALGATDVEEVARFYREVFELDELTRHVYDDGALRSIWLDLGGAILMVERTEAAGEPVVGIGAGPFLLAFSVKPSKREAMEATLERWGAQVEERTAYTSYARDPEGNRVAISHYPD